MISRKKLLVEDRAEIHLITDRGVYLIDDRYIGESDDFGKRLKQHVDSPEKGGHNPELTTYIEQQFKNGKKIRFKQISKDQKAEVPLIRKYAVNYDLLNKQGMPTVEELHNLRERRQRLMKEANAIITEIERLSIEKLFERNTSKEAEKQKMVFIQMMTKQMELFLTDSTMRESITTKQANNLNELKKEIGEREFNGEPHGIPEEFWNVNVPVVEEMNFDQITVTRDTSKRNETFAR